jgi:hypothetical protein
VTWIKLYHNLVKYTGAVVMPRAMRTRILFVLALLGTVACAGLANDINRGAANTERELKGEPRTPQLTADAGTD